MEGLNLITVEIVLALEDRQILRRLLVPAGTQVATLIERSGLLAESGGEDPSTSPVGIFGRLCMPETPLCDGDRVELYRPLRADPKTARRQRAAHKAKVRQVEPR